MTQTATLTNLLKSSFVEMMKDVATSIPGHVAAFDPVTQLAQIQIGIKRVDVNGVTFTPSPLIEVPVYFSGGAQYGVEHQVDPNDEGMILFSQRCIDGWFNTGGVAENPILRFHSMEDAIFLPGLRSQPNALASFANNGVRLRNVDATHYVWLKNDGTVEIKNSNSTMTISAAGDFEGTFNSFNITSPTFTHNGTDVGESHMHLPGTYNIGGSPVVDNSGTPV